MPESKLSEADKARIETLVSIIADAVNEFHENGGNASVTIQSLMQCIEAFIDKHNYPLLEHVLTCGVMAIKFDEMMKGCAQRKIDKETKP